jgi:hypothetical protein
MGQPAGGSGFSGRSAGVQASWSPGALVRCETCANPSAVLAGTVLGLRSPGAGGKEADEGTPHSIESPGEVRIEIGGRPGRGSAIAKRPQERRCVTRHSEPFRRPWPGLVGLLIGGECFPTLLGW